MCGIAGYVDPDRSDGPRKLKSVAAGMAARLVHRGPDDRGSFVDADVGLGIAFRRLSIQDLGVDGRQPMRSADGRYVIAYNGEVYNFRELRDSLVADGVDGWRGGSDTEVMLAAISRHGLERAVQRFDGMFAFALWDTRERTLTLVRDRMGEKPLYYGWSGSVFLFASELKALTAHPGWASAIDKDALAAYMHYSYVPAPRSIYQGIFKLPPGHTLTLKLDRLQPGHLPRAAPYWNARTITQSAAENPFQGSAADAVDELDRLLTRSIGRRLIADVPLGTFLSGGIDSSTVTALAQKLSDRPINSFTIGFDDPRHDESPHAASVARHLGTNHTELRADPKAILDLVEPLPEVYDEPFADVSQLPTLLLARLTRKHVTVALSGDGGDELFAGYARYRTAAARWRRASRLPAPVRSVLRRAPTVLPLSALNRLTSIGSKPARLGDKLYRMLTNYGARSPEQVHQGVMSRWRLATPPMPAPAVGFFSDPNAALSLADPAARMMYADAVSYLPDDLLVKIDRATMSVGLEGRAPLLDHDIVAFAWGLPLEMKVQNGVTKWALREVLCRYVPRALIDRPKQGFEPPLGDWLRGPLRDWAENLLQPARLAESGLTHTSVVRAVWDEHQRGVRNWPFELWNVLMYQAWRQAWGR